MHPKHIKKTPTQTRSNGFSLIELMIVMVIIAVLASVAIPGFQDQVARSHVMGALSELRSLTTAYEDLTLRGMDTFTLEDLGLNATQSSTTTDRCVLTLNLPDETTGDGGLTCVIQGSPRIRGYELHLNRDGQQGLWTCNSSLEDAFRPDGCEAMDGP